MLFFVLTFRVFVNRSGLVCRYTAWTVLQPILHAGTDEQPGEDATQQRVRTETIASVVLIVAFANCKETWNVRLVVLRRARLQAAFCRSFVVCPQTAHAVVNGRKDLHRMIAWIDSLELLVDLEDAAKLAIEFLARDVRKVEVHALAIFLDATTFVDANVENLACRDVTRH